MSWMHGLLRRLFGDYEIYTIYRLDLPRPSVLLDSRPSAVRLRPLDAAEDWSHLEPELASQKTYAGADAVGLGAELAGRLVAGCWFWYGERYRTARNFWPLRSGEAKLVQITTSESCRGRGIGLTLMRYAAERMAERGFTRLYARIWHSNRPSLALFQRAGWRKVANVLVLQPLGRGRGRRIVVGAERR